MNTPGTGWDLYREIHKALRFAVAGVTTQAGSADAGDEQAVRALLDEWDDVAFVLHGHHAHEDEFCDPLIRRHAADLRDELERAHHEADRQLAALQTAADGIRAATPSERDRLLLGFHLALADFEASYLPYLRFEECMVMPALNAAIAGGRRPPGRPDAVPDAGDHPPIRPRPLCRIAHRRRRRAGVRAVGGPHDR